MEGRGVTEYATPSGRAIDFLAPRRGRPLKPEPVPITAEFEHRKTQAEIANERFVEALQRYFRNGGKA